MASLHCKLASLELDSGSSTPPSQPCPWTRLLDELKLRVMYLHLVVEGTIRRHEHAEILKNCLAPILGTGNRQLTLMAKDTYYTKNTFRTNYCWREDFGWHLKYPPLAAGSLIRKLIIKLFPRTSSTLERMVTNDGVWGILLRPLEQPRRPKNASQWPRRKSYHPPQWQKSFNNLDHLELEIVVQGPTLYPSKFHQCFKIFFLQRFRDAVQGTAIDLMARNVEVNVLIQGCRLNNAPPVNCAGEPSLDSHWIKPENYEVKEIRNCPRPDCGCEEEVASILKSMIQKPN
ncbi:hypothetical protein BDV95DRAFT_603115 [Massariosphaeria phaeospora]|uniref:Uncharacterized protein n=1 Tax=Massariosphaeria phaeospora TaxID=100035 RepID=A0A7C8IE74_9PLEO|nr:hypothetical protein BDV95DRAFT_603115 [Massariosphaeria phaeospora]